jgi:ribosome-associated protein
MERTFSLTQEYIELGQLLKVLDVVGSGGEVKDYLASHFVTVNGVEDNRRGRKLRAGDVVVIDDGVLTLRVESEAKSPG